MFNRQESLLYKIVYFGLEYFGRYYSTYHGIVVENEDPLGMNRVKVTFPQLVEGDPSGMWAKSKGSWGGDNYGLNLIPQIGDLVYIEFSHGDLEYPIWQHSSFYKGSKPTEFHNSNVFGFKTPNGTTVIIDDNKDGGNILVKYKTGKEYIKITEDILQLESKEIKLGMGNEPAVLGKTHTDLISELITEISKLTTTLSTHTHPGDGTPPVQSVGIIATKNKLTNLSGKLSDSLSTKVKLD